MKRTKTQPSVLGLLLIVAGMILLSTLLLMLAGRGTVSSENSRLLFTLAGAGILSLVVGSALSARRRK
jgi:hypothetical protein